MSDSVEVEALTATLSRPRAQETLGRRPTGVTLEVLTGPNEGQRFELRKRTVITGGRAPNHDVVLEHDSVSLNHFEMKLGPGGVSLRDLGSTNGTWLGRSRLDDGTATLFDGATFYAGDIKLRLAEIAVGSVARSTSATLGTMTGHSPAMAELFALLSRLAATPITTLVMGETGTGKEEVARTLHQLSMRTGPFVVLDCGAIPAGLAESRIFGHMRGAFTGAIADAPGVFERANGGTLLLDEVGELPLDLQPKLLRVLDRPEVQRVGDDTVRQVDVRVIAATNRNLARAVADGAFRLDLFHRLGQIEIVLPPLRSRPEDIPILAERFLAEFRQRHERHLEIDSDAINALSQLRWEGNVRQLKQMVESMAFLAEEDVINLECLRKFGGARGVQRPQASAADVNGWMSQPYKQAADEFQEKYFSELFRETDGDIDEICKRSGYSRKGLRGVAKRLGLPWSGPG